ncbi:hypothetical protein phiOC_p403 [Ochrobactrum phage vB_OspM_OC]|nr:hypothetical protein phiOC_p403 [Ochrobactrum phage vB_OspM_OC]
MDKLAREIMERKVTINKDVNLERKDQPSKKYGVLTDSFSKDRELAREIMLNRTKQKEEEQDV